MAKRWRIHDPVNDADFECEAKTRHDAIKAARDADFIPKNDDDQYRPVGSYIITQLEDE